MKTAFRLPFLTIKTGISPIFCKVKDPSEIPIGLLAWCARRDLNPYVINTRPSNVPVCQFQHSRSTICIIA